MIAATVLSIVALALYARACWRKIKKLPVGAPSKYDFLGRVQSPARSHN